MQSLSTGSLPSRQDGTLCELTSADLASKRLPDNQYSLVGVDTETGILVNAELAISSIGHVCVTCMEAIEMHEHHVAIGGRYWTNRQGEVVDHHHAHADCFQEYELAFWAARARVSSSFRNYSALSSHHSSTPNITDGTSRAA